MSEMQHNNRYFKGNSNSFQSQLNVNQLNNTGSYTSNNGYHINQIANNNNMNTKSHYNNNHKNYSKNIRCNNCGLMGHFSKNCSKPITSYGIILLNINNNLNSDSDSNLESNQISQKVKKIKERIYDYFNVNYKYDNNRNETVCSEFFTNKDNQELFCKCKDLVQFLMISRKHSIGYMEFLRGRYKINDIDGIQSLFKQMLPEEVKKIASWDFVQLWDDMWSNNTKDKHNNSATDNKDKNTPKINDDNPIENKQENTIHKSYHHDFLMAQKKFEKIKNAKNMQGIFPLDWYIKKTKTLYTFNEWGFPKGRKNFKETNLECACREFGEETGLSENDFKIFNNIMPIEEIFTGTDGVVYKYVYYVAGLLNDNISLDVQKLSDLGEVGDIGWFNYDEAFNNIRPYHTARLHILTNFHLHLLNVMMKVDISNLFNTAFEDENKEKNANTHIDTEEFKETKNDDDDDEKKDKINDANFLSTHNKTITNSNSLCCATFSVNSTCG